jgi:hypothetical protein
MCWKSDCGVCVGKGTYFGTLLRWPPLLGITDSPGLRVPAPPDSQRVDHAIGVGILNSIGVGRPGKKKSA